MIGNFRNKRSFALSGTAERTVLAEICKESSASFPLLNIIASAEGPPDQEITLHRLFASMPDVRGAVSVALPLHFFEIVKISIPLMPEEAVGRALPYHLAKAVDKPLQDYIYDWQLNRVNKDGLEITAYLFPAATFNSLRTELASKQLELKYLEPDVFAAFAYLDLTGRLSSDDATLCTLVWPGNSSHAIFEKGQLKLVRSVPMNQPVRPYKTEQNEAVPAEQPDVALVSSASQTTPKSAARFFAAGVDNDSILAGFSLTARDDAQPVAPPMAMESADLDNSAGTNGPDHSRPDAPAADWSEYINRLGLEVIRTRDFYGLILKGSNIGHFFVGGGEEFLQELGEVTSSAMGMEPEELAGRELAQNQPPPLGAICIGTGVR